MRGQPLRTAILMGTGALLLAAGIFLEDREPVALALIVIGAGEVTMGVVLPRLAELEIGPTKFAAKLRERDAEFGPLFERQAPQLARLATLLAGHEQGSELAQESLAQTYAKLPRAQREGPELHARKELARALSKRPASPGAPGGTLVGALADLGSESRVAVTLKLYEQLDDDAIALVLGKPAGEVQRLIREGAERVASELAQGAGGAA